MVTLQFVAKQRKNDSWTQTEVTLFLQTIYDIESKEIVPHIMKL
jgi:hypothetical protein